jgi:hypothetical protein
MRLMKMTVMLKKCRKLSRQAKFTMRATLRKATKKMMMMRRLKMTSKKGRKIYLMMSRAVKMKRWRPRRNPRKPILSLERAL